MGPSLVSPPSLLPSPPFPSLPCFSRTDWISISPFESQCPHLKAGNQSNEFRGSQEGSREITYLISQPYLPSAASYFPLPCWLLIFPPSPSSPSPKRWKVRLDQPQRRRVRLGNVRFLYTIPPCLAATVWRWPPLWVALTILSPNELPPPAAASRSKQPLNYLLLGTFHWVCGHNVEPYNK